MIKDLELVQKRSLGDCIFFLYQMSFIEVIVNIKRTLKRVWWHWLRLDFGKVKGDFSKHVCENISFSWLLPKKRCSANMFVLKVCVEDHEANRPKDSDEHWKKWTISTLAPSKATLYYDQFKQYHHLEQRLAPPCPGTLQSRSASRAGSSWGRDG